MAVTLKDIKAANGNERHNLSVQWGQDRFLNGYPGQQVMEHVERLETALADLTRERDEFKSLNQHHKEQFLKCNLELAELRKAYADVLREAVRFAELVASWASHECYRDHAKYFLDQHKTTHQGQGEETK